MKYKKIFFSVLFFASLFISQSIYASDPIWFKLREGYYGTWDYATTGTPPLVSHCGFKITWQDIKTGQLIAESVRNQTNGGGCSYVLLHYQCAGTTCLSRNSNPIDLLPDGSFVFYSYKYNLPMKYTFFGHEDQTQNLYMGYGSSGVVSGYCSNYRCPEAHQLALEDAIHTCKSAGHSTCDEIWSEQIDYLTTPLGYGAHYFVTVRGNENP